MEGDETMRRTFWLVRNIVESSFQWNWEKRMGREGRREREMAAPEDSEPHTGTRVVGRPLAGFSSRPLISARSQRTCRIMNNIKKKYWRNQNWEYHQEEGEDKVWAGRIISV